MQQANLPRLAAKSKQKRPGQHLWRWLALLCLAVLTLASAQGDDSTAAIAAGGIELLRSDAVAMQRQEMFITPEKVSVDFVFANETASPVDSLVAFVVPDVALHDLDKHAIAPAALAESFAFTVRSDGREIEPQVDLRSDGANLRLRFYWPQSFPAGKKVAIRHSYRPLLGGSLIEPQIERQDQAATSLSRLYCLDDADWTAISAVAQARAERSGLSATLSGAFLDYTLSTGANWKGVINELLIGIAASENSKGGEGGGDAFLASCLTGLRRLDGTIWLRFADFKPTSDLRLLFINLPQAAND